MVCRVQGVLYALEDLCSHAETTLSDGLLNGYQIVCPLHGASFDVRTGAHSGPPAWCGVKAFTVAERPDGAVVDLAAGDDDGGGDVRRPADAVPHPLVSGACHSPEVAQPVAIPGPSVVPDRVLSAMHRAMPDIYGGELLEVSDEIFAELPRIAGMPADGRTFVTISNGHGAWEMAISNTLSRGDKVLVLESGRFAVSVGRDGGVLGRRRSRSCTPPTGARSTRPRCEARLQADVTERSRRSSWCTSTRRHRSATTSPRCVRAMDAADHPALLMVDCIASMGCEQYEMDEWGVDLTLAASQKGLMVPPGAGLRVGRPARAGRARTAGLRTGYWDWTRPYSRAPTTCATAAPRRCPTCTACGRR